MNKYNLLLLDIFQSGSETFNKFSLAKLLNVSDVRHCVAQMYVFSYHLKIKYYI